ITQATVQGLQQKLNENALPARVYLGYKHTSPFIAETVERMVREGIRETVALVLAPHYSALSVETYLAEVHRAALETPLRVHEIRSWHLHPGLIQLLAERVHAARQKLRHPERAPVIFSAHSLPARILQQGDPYPKQLRETGQAVAHRLGLERVTYAWQSAGRTAEEWLGPDILVVLRQLAEEGCREVVVCPAGFVSDHLEVLYDIDIECRQLADSLGMRLVRTESLNDDPDFIRVLADLAEQELRQPGRERE
ncbi:MAG: ferrochelatase, partial [Alicyclobacillus herbarius]|uniref:ferrochelatase n=1 Tax=Alicyclobacillus herbarius TaxID=122960 RepID=UPI00235703C9